MPSGVGLFAFLSLASTALGGRIEYLGVAIPGIDFGCDIDGSCPLDNIKFPLKEYGGGDGAEQMKHFVGDDRLNVFRLPTPWQWLTNEQPNGDLDPDNFDKYNELMDACLETGAYCMIDVHNFARYDGGIIGQGGPEDEAFVDLWVSLAKKYADNEKIIFGLMNEPHDLDVNIWAKTCQKVVTGIRKAGAEKHMILLPGTNFASAETFVSSGSAEALAAITNPDGSTDGLLLDIHKYLDINNSGSHMECTTDNVEEFKEIIEWLRDNDRKAMVSESGASLDETCMTRFCTQNEMIAENTDVIIGFVAWGAGSFDYDYTLTLTPLGSPPNYEDNDLMKECVLAPFARDGVGPSSTIASSTRTTSRSSSTATSTSTATNSETSSSGIHRPPTPTEATDNSATTEEDNAGNGNDNGSMRSVEVLSSGLLVVGFAIYQTGLRFF